MGQSRPVAPLEDYDETPAAIDLETLDAMADWAIEQRLAEQERLDAEHDEMEARWAEEDARREAEERRAQAADDAENALLLRAVDECKKAGIEDEHTIYQVLQAASGVARDPDWLREHAHSRDWIGDALAEGRRLVWGEADESISSVAERFVDRRAALERHADEVAGIHTPSAVDEALFDAHATALGSTPAEKAAAREALGRAEAS